MGSHLGRRGWIAATGAVAVLALAACSPQWATGATAPVTAVPVADLPAPFDGEPVEVALVQQSGTSDDSIAWIGGARAQAAAANIELTVTDARSDNAVHASNLAQAIASQPDAIIVDRGQADTVEHLVHDAVDARIPVIVHDLELEDTEGVLVTSPSDAAMAEGVLRQLIEDVGDGADVGYVGAEGSAALERRTAVWEEFVAENDLNELFFAVEGADSPVTGSMPLVDAALEQHPEVQAVFAPDNEIAAGVVRAVRRNDLQDSVKVYGVGISDGNIEAMIAEDSPWAATGAIDPAAIGAAVVRTLALSLAGELDLAEVHFPAATITRDFLLENEIQGVSALRKAEPALVLEDFLVAEWLPALWR